MTLAVFEDLYLASPRVLLSHSSPLRDDVLDSVPDWISPEVGGCRLCGHSHCIFHSENTISPNVNDIHTGSMGSSQTLYTFLDHVEDHRKWDKEAICQSQAGWDNRLVVELLSWWSKDRSSHFSRK